METSTQAKQPHWREIAMAAAFLFAGYMDAYMKALPNKTKHGGQVEVASDLADCARAIEVYLAQPSVAQIDFPGVYLYEVAEPVGALLYQQEDITPTTALKVHHEFMKKWFADDGLEWPGELLAWPDTHITAAA